MSAKRLWLLDVLRGAALVNMLAYHALYDWVYVFGHESWYDIWSPAAMYGSSIFAGALFCCPATVLHWHASL